MNKKRKIPLKNFDNDLAYIFKRKLDQKGIGSWKELTHVLNIDNPRTFIDFLNGKQCVKKEYIDKLFEVLELDERLREIYLEPVIRYKLKEE